MPEDSSQYTDKQIQIVETARRIITLKGIENLTIREIAKDLRITDGAIYRHFKSKNAIVSLLIDDIEKTLLKVIDVAAEKAEGPLEKLKSIFLSHISYAEQRRGVSFIVINETLNLQNKGLRKKMFGIINRYLIKIREILVSGIESGTFRKDIDIVSASIAFFGMVQSTVTLWALSGFKYSLRKDRIDELLSIYMKGIVS